MLKIYNTQSKKKEEISSRSNEKHLYVYTCGPTVYDFAHIGNFRTYVAEDILRRVLKFFDFKVTQVMNITDVDDKTIRRALSEHVSLAQATEPFIKAFFEDLKILKIQPVEYYPLATDFIPRMIQMIDILLNKHIAYRAADGSIYYNIKKFPNYGKLSHLHLDQLQVGASNRVQTDEYDKEEAVDFVLWKSYDPQRDGNIYWESPFGKGRPGWHLECSAMAMELLGSTIDIHAGGVDNIFPHHENEIAQSEAITETSFARYWFHVEHLLVDRKKMSKSLGNFFTLRDLLKKGYTGRQIRYLLLQTHYRTQLNFTFQGLDAAKHSLERMEACFERLRHLLDSKNTFCIDSILANNLNLFTQALADDLNISVALSVVFDLIREINQLCDQNKIGSKESKQFLTHFGKLNEILDVLPIEESILSISPELQRLLDEREEARKLKQWAKADDCRKKILACGYTIEDTAAGSRLKKMEG